MTVETKASPPPVLRLAGRVTLVLLIAAGVALAWLYRDALDAPAIAATIRGYRRRRSGSSPPISSPA